MDFIIFPLSTGIALMFLLKLYRVNRIRKQAAGKTRNNGNSKRQVTTNRKIRT